MGPGGLSRMRTSRRELINPRHPRDGDGSSGGDMVVVESLRKREADSSRTVYGGRGGNPATSCISLD